MELAVELASLSGFTKVSITGLKSNIPTPALLGVVLNVPIKASVLLRFIDELLTWTSAINLTLYLVATIVGSDTAKITCCPIGSVVYNGFWSIDTAMIFDYFGL